MRNSLQGVSFNQWLPGSQLKRKMNGKSLMNSERKSYMVTAYTVVLFYIVAPCSVVKFNGKIIAYVLMNSVCMLLLLFLIFLQSTATVPRYPQCANHWYWYFNRFIPWLDWNEEQYWHTDKSLHIFLDLQTYISNKKERKSHENFTIKNANNTDREQ